MYSRFGEQNVFTPLLKVVALCADGRIFICCRTFAPQSVWAFHNIRSILPVAEIENAPGRTLAANRIVIAKVSSQNSAIDNQALWLTHKAVPELRRCLLADASQRAAE